MSEIPEGEAEWVLVPRHMTTDMMGAYHHAKRVETSLSAIWSAILAAAPKPPHEPLFEITRRDGKEPCGECRIQPNEVCDICGAVHSPAPSVEMEKSA